MNCTNITFGASRSNAYGKTVPRPFKEDCSNYRRGAAAMKDRSPTVTFVKRCGVLRRIPLPEI